jgi:hypothetical protein
VPEWFPVLRVFQAVDAPTSTYINLPIGTYDVLCASVDKAGIAHVTGRTVVHIS